MPTMKMKKIKRGFKGLERERPACQAFEGTLKSFITIPFETNRNFLFALSRSLQAGRLRSSRLSLNRFSVLMCAVLLTFACTPRSFEKPAASSVPLSTAEDKRASFENDLQTMRTANLQYVFVVRRKDDGAFDGDDKKYLRATLPFNNRIILADEEKAFIVGSNYKFPPENLDALRMRFNVEDYSAAEPAK